MKFAAYVGIGLVAVACACKSKQAAPAATGSGSSAPTVAGSGSGAAPVAGSGSGSGAPTVAGSGSGSAAFEPWCAVAQQRDGDLQRIEDCVEQLGPWSFKIKTAIAAKIPSSKGKPAEARFAGGAAYVKPDGELVVVKDFDNGPDYFAEGLARSRGADGKLGFINERLEQVIAPTFDFVEPFEGGRAAYCVGCTEQSEGEHTTMVGGQWGYIDKTGKALGALVPQAEFQAAPRR